VKKFPEVIDHLLGNIPRLDEVREIIDCLMGNPLPYENKAKEEVYKAYRIIDAALEHDYLEVEGHDSEVILGTLRGGEKEFDKDVVEAMSQLLHKSKTRYLVNEVAFEDLRVGMRLAEDLSLESAMLIAPKGTDISRHFLQVLHNYESCYDRSPFPKLIKVFVREGEEASV